jgi:flagellar basal-body rod protein FlgB
MERRGNSLAAPGRKEVEQVLGDIFETTDLLQKGLNASQLRHETIANNIANVDTPGFKASHVEFEAYMKRALEGEEDGAELKMKVSREGHIRSGEGLTDAADVEPAVIRDDSTTMRLDGNNVDIDNEMVQLSKNNLYYYMLVTKLNGEISRLKTAIDGR